MINKERLEEHLKALIELDSKDYDLVYLGTHLDDVLSSSRVLVKFLIDNWNKNPWPHFYHCVTLSDLFESLQS